MANKKTKRKAIDWEAVEKEYRIGQKTVRSLAKEFNCAHPTIVRRAKKHGWVQDKSKEVREKTKAALLAHQREDTKKHTTPTTTDIDVAVQANIEIILSHRKGVKRLRKIIGALADKIQGYLDAGVDIKQVGSLASSVKSLTLAEKEAIQMERQAFNLDDSAGGLEVDGDKTWEITFRSANGTTSKD